MLLQVTTHSHASPESNRTLTACIACVRGSPGMAAEERARAKQELLVRCSLMVKIRIWVRPSVPPPPPTHTHTHTNTHAHIHYYTRTLNDGAAFPFQSRACVARFVNDIFSASRCFCRPVWHQPHAYRGKIDPNPTLPNPNPRAQGKARPPSLDRPVAKVKKKPPTHSFSRTYARG